MTERLTIPADSPIGVASTWINAVLRIGSLRLAWPHTTLDLREGLVADWLAAYADHPHIAEQDPDQVVEDLASFAPQRFLLWHAFELAQILQMRALWSDIDLDRWGWATDPRPVAVDVEGVLLVDPERIDEGCWAPALAFLLRMEDGELKVMAVDAPGQLELERG